MNDTDIAEVAEQYSYDLRFLSNDRNQWFEVTRELHDRFGFVVGDEIWDAACSIFLARVTQAYYESDEA
jgi:vacuolar-type H+-ATPase catalytic subunit A/Vma1